MCPGYSGYLAFWVNQEIMDEVGITSIDTKEDFMKYMEAVSGDGRYGYGGSWEKTYVFNEIAQFVNMFGGDYFDWTNPANKEAIQFLHDMVQNGQTPIDQIADKYEQMNPKANDGKYGSWFMWGLGTDYEKADMLGAGQDTYGNGSGFQRKRPACHLHGFLELCSEQGIREQGSSSQIPGIYGE